MTDRDARILKASIERKYGEDTEVILNDSSILPYNKTIIDANGVALYTDGIIEKNDKDDFINMNIVGFSYVMFCYHGKQFSELSGPRIAVHVTSRSKLSLIKRNVFRILNNYT